MRQNQRIPQNRNIFKSFIGQNFFIPQIKILKILISQFVPGLHPCPCMVKIYGRIQVNGLLSVLFKSEGWNSGFKTEFHKFHQQQQLKREILGPFTITIHNNDLLIILANIINSYDLYMLIIRVYKILFAKFLFYLIDNW